MRDEDEGLAPGEEKLIPEWSVAADDQIVVLGMLVVGVFLALFAWNNWFGGDGTDDTIGDPTTAFADTGEQVAGPIAIGAGADASDIEAAAPTTVAPTTEAPTTAAPTTAAPTTAAPTTEAPTTTAAPTTEAPTTTALDLQPDVDAAIAGVTGASASVDGTIVTLTGEVADDAARTAAVDAASAVPGVSDVVDQLTVAAPAVVTQLNDLFELEPIQFGSNSAEILPTSFGTLDAAAAILAENTAAIEIQGYTDVRGPEVTNLTLSQARADAVLAYLVSKGVDGDNLQATGYGETTQFGEGDSPDALAANRRVRFELI